MSEFIYREIWLTESRRIETIAVSENSKVPIMLKVMDVPISGTAKVYAYNGKTGEYTANNQPSAVSGNTVTIIPDYGLFLAGNDKLQVHFQIENGDGITRDYPVICAPDFSNGGKTPKAESVKDLVQRVEETEARANEVAKSIPADFSLLSENVMQMGESLRIVFNYEEIDISSLSWNLGGWDGTKVLNVDYLAKTIYDSRIEFPKGAEFSIPEGVMLTVGLYSGAGNNTFITDHTLMNGGTYILGTDCRVSLTVGYTDSRTLSEADIPALVANITVGMKTDTTFGKPITNAFIDDVLNDMS